MLLLGPYSSQVLVIGIPRLKIIIMPVFFSCVLGKKLGTWYWVQNLLHRLGNTNRQLRAAIDNRRPLVSLVSCISVSLFARMACVRVQTKLFVNYVLGVLSEYTICKRVQIGTRRPYCTWYPWCSGVAEVCLESIAPCDTSNVTLICSSRIYDMTHRSASNDLNNVS